MARTALAGRQAFVRADRMAHVFGGRDRYMLSILSTSDCLIAL